MSALPTLIQHHSMIIISAIGKNKKGYPDYSFIISEYIFIVLILIEYVLDIQCYVVKFFLSMSESSLLTSGS